MPFYYTTAADKMSIKDTIKKQLWQELLKIPLGTTLSYSLLAVKMGIPGQTRYIASLLKENPFLIAIPCHRVIKKNGQYGGYVLGENFKKYLIEWEKSFNGNTLR